MKLHIITGDIENVVADVVVNSTYGIYRISRGEIEVEGNDDNCDKVYHLTLPDWSDDEEAEELLGEMIEECLQKADEDHESIAFPPLGTGSLGYPAATVASVFLDTINEFVDFESKQLTCVKIVLCPDNEEVLETDVIVNSTTNSLNLNSGPLTKAILEAGGNTLRKECKRDYPHGIKEDEIAVTSGGDLSCEAVYHTTSCPYGPGAEEKLRNLILLCLQEADEAGRESISFPALGTGILKYPPDVVARCFCETTTSFFGYFLTKTRVAFQKEVRRFSSQNTVDSFRVSVVKGNITQQDVDVIVNSTTPDLNLSSGPLSQAILKAGGQGLQDDCKSNYPDGIQIGDIAETSGGNMPCQAVYHITLPDDAAEAEQVLCTLIQNCLTLAASQGKRRIAFPVLGTGRLNYPRDSVAKCVFKSFDEFSSSNVGTTLVEARIVVYPKDADNLLVFEDLSAVYAAPDQSTETCPSKAVARLSSQEHRPGHWSPMSDQEVMTKVQLAPGLKEFKTVAQQFAQGTNNKYSIIKIERIQNCTLHRQYQVQAECMGKRNKGQKMETHLWHGTSEDAVTDINSYGFNRSYSGKNAAVYGEGSYFAVSPNYSANDTYSPPDSDGNKRMYQVAVLTGHYTKGAKGMRVPPVRENGIKYDTVVDDPNNPTMFVVFNDVQAYPKYLVTFK